jgi:hypothetical protein
MVRNHKHCNPVYLVPDAGARGRIRVQDSFENVQDIEEEIRFHPLPGNDVLQGWGLHVQRGALPCPANRGIIKRMRMENRKPRASRFEADNAEARLAQLRQQAPVLSENKKLRWYAIFGSALMLLTVAAFYLAMQIYKAANEYRKPDHLIQVDQAPEIEETNLEQLIDKVEADKVAAEQAYEDQVKSLQEVDLLGELDAAVEAQTEPMPVETKPIEEIELDLPEIQ